MTDEELLALWNAKNGKPYRKTPSQPEHNLQVACVQWFRMQYPGLLLMSIPNGGWRKKATAAKLKQEGAIAGVPDLLLAHPSNRYHGLWIEMKNGKAGRLSEHQKIVIPQLQKEGYQVVVARTFDEFRRSVTEYLVRKVG